MINRKKIACFFMGNLSSENVFSIAGIHASVISILFGLSIAYVLHINTQFSEIENDAVNIAEHVNEIRFSPIWYKLVGPSGLFLENWSSKEDQIQGWLSSYWVDPSGKYTIDHSKDTQPFKVYFSDLHFNHTEFKLCLMGTLALKYPFPERMVIEGNKLRALQPSPAIIFRNMGDIKRWNEEVKKKFKHLVDAINWFGTSTFINGFDWSAEINLHNKLYKIDSKESYDSHTLKEFQVVPKEFCSNVKEIFEISRSLDHKIRRFDYLNALNPSKAIAIFSLIFAMVTFVSGIIVPIINQPISKILIVWIPTAFYMYFFIYLAVKVFSII